MNTLNPSARRKVGDRQSLPSDSGVRHALAAAARQRVIFNAICARRAAAVVAQATRALCLRLAEEEAPIALSHSAQTSNRTDHFQ
jgi:alpha-D-ribose 1-methylphosphonate 5-triphosphate synthase subunit PhnH